MTERTQVAWKRRTQTDVPHPVVREVPYLEIKLEHPDLEPTGQLDRSYPDGVPYGQDPEAKVFFWRPVLDPAGPDPAAWIGAVATTHGFGGIEQVPASAPSLVEEDGSDVTVIVDGTIVGDSYIAQLRGYEPPSMQVTHVSAGEVALSINGSGHSIKSGNRRRLSLANQDVRYVGGGRSTRTAPELVVRYPGTRTVHHPAVGTVDRLFPSFGLDLERVSNPVPVPTHNGELDHVELAAELEVNRSDRPYAERVLWQAFAFTAFDPHGKGMPVLGQTSDGHLVVSPPNGE
jgi:hypothetical protein